MHGGTERASHNTINGQNSITIVSSSRASKAINENRPKTTMSTIREKNKSVLVSKSDKKTLEAFRSPAKFGENAKGGMFGAPKSNAGASTNR